MSPEYFIIPIIMGQASSVIEAIKTGIIVFDCGILLFLFFMFYNADMEYLRSFYTRWQETTQSTIIISTEIKTRSVKFRAIMHYLAKNNDKTIHRLKEDTEFDWDAREIRSEYLVEQYKEFKLTEAIYGKIKNERREKSRSGNGDNVVMIDYNTLTIYSYKLNTGHLQKWIDGKVKDYKEHLKQTSNEKQLFITVSTTNGSGKSGENENKKRDGNNSNIMIDSVEWESSITFENSYFQNMTEIIKKIDFFLNNKEWYLQKGIPYNLGILLYGEPGCGKTRFIKQLMNHTGRHGIDIKLNDGMDFTELQNIIYKEELDDIHIIPQNQRIIIFEDIDALGEVVKERDLKTSSATGSAMGPAQKKEEEASNELKMISNLFKMSEAANSGLAAKNNNNLSYLLNMLDGIHECSGRIIIMTTNKPDVLDKALIRPGRIDLKINFQKCSRYDIMKMVETFWSIMLPLETILPENEGKYTCAEIINLFRASDDFTTVREILCVPITA